MDAALTVEALPLRKFDDFYRAEFPSIFRAAYLAVGNRDDAFDVAQEAFKRAFVRWRSLAEQPWAGGWVMTTAVNLSRRARRARSRLPTGAKDGGALTEEASVGRIDVSSALARLPRRQMTAVVLFYIGDFAVPEIAQLMDISEGTVKAHLAQGRAALRRTLEVSDA